MQIDVSLHGVFRIDRFKQRTCTYPDAVSARQVVDDLKIPHGLLGIVLINGIHATIDSPLSDGDRLTLLPLLDGG